MRLYYSLKERKNQQFLGQNTMRLYFSQRRQRLCVSATGFHHSRKSRPISNQATEQTALVILPIKERRDFLHDRSPHHLDNQLIHILCRFSGRKKLVTKSKKRFPHQPYLVRGQLNHSFLCFTAEHLQHHSFLPPLYPQMCIMANVQMRIFRKANTAAY